MSDMEEKLQIYTIQNDAGMKAEILNYGATIMSLWVPDKLGNLYDVLLGYRLPASYLQPDNPYFNCAVGRYANRIKNGCFELNQITYNLDTGGQKHCLHSGPTGFDKKLWQVVEQSNNEITLGLISENGEGGFPGKLEVKLIYRLTENNILHIKYITCCGQDCPVNLTFHGYFNLGGKGTGGHHLSIDAMSYLEVDGDLIPSGRTLSVENTVYDFRVEKLLSPLYAEGITLDHCFIVNTEERLNQVAKVVGEQLTMTVHTNLPGLQVYTGNGLHPGIEGVKKAGGYSAFDGVCLEAQYYPDAPNHAHFPSPVIKAGEERTDIIEYRFS
jgi:aldose 1-epimerase